MQLGSHHRDYNGMKLVKYNLSFRHCSKICLWWSSADFFKVFLPVAWWRLQYLRLVSLLCLELLISLWNNSSATQRFIRWLHLDHDHIWHLIALLYLLWSAYWPSRNKNFELLEIRHVCPSNHLSSSISGDILVLQLWDANVLSIAQAQWGRGKEDFK
jgi:hypothetical protein